MTTIDLDAIRALMARRDELAGWPTGPDDADERWRTLFALADEVPGLVAEVERLRAERDATWNLVDWVAIRKAVSDAFTQDRISVSQAVDAIADAIQQRVFHDRDLDTYLRPDDASPHDDPAVCPTWNDWCHCTVTALKMQVDYTEELLARLKLLDRLLTAAGVTERPTDEDVTAEAAEFRDEPLLPVLAKLDWFTAERDAADGWFRDGKEVAIQELETSTKPENPHAEGSPAAQWWSRGYSYNWRQFNALRAARERDAAEGKVLPAGWRLNNGVFDRDVKGRDDLIYVRVQRGYLGDAGTWLRPSALILPVDGVHRGRVSARVEAHRIEADTILTAIEAAEAWLKENPR